MAPLVAILLAGFLVLALPLQAADDTRLLLTVGVVSTLLLVAWSIFFLWIGNYPYSSYNGPVSYIALTTATVAFLIGSVLRLVYLALLAREDDGRTVLLWLSLATLAAPAGALLYAWS